jgi:DNA modification methylase
MTAKAKYMEVRKRQTRSGRTTVATPTQAQPNGNGKRLALNLLNDLTSKEWTAETISVWVQRGLGKTHKDAQIEREHPAPFSYQDIARLIRFFTKRGQTILDPFVGVGSTLKAAALEGRRGIGIELNPRYAALAKKRLHAEICEAPGVCWDQTVLTGDAAKLVPNLAAASVNLVVTSPPYWNILHKEDHKARQERRQNGLDARYSDDPHDLGNIPEYAVFLDRLADVLGACRRVLVDGGHMCIVVGDFRDKARYHMFHADLASAMESRGFTLKGLTILHQKHKRIFPYGYPYAYVPNLHHQYILILKKDG